jgi:hypothetical protein
VDARQQRAVTWHLSTHSSIDIKETRAEAKITSRHDVMAEWKESCLS